MYILKNFYKKMHNYYVFCNNLVVFCLVYYVPHSWVSGLTQQAIAQWTGGPRYLQFNVLTREDAKGLPFTDVNAKAALSPYLFQDLE